MKKFALLGLAILLSASFAMADNIRGAELEKNVLVGYSMITSGDLAMIGGARNMYIKNGKVDPNNVKLGSYCELVFDREAYRGDAMMTGDTYDIISVKKEVKKHGRISINRPVVTKYHHMIAVRPTRDTMNRLEDDRSPRLLQINCIAKGERPYNVGEMLWELEGLMTLK